MEWKAFLRPTKLKILILVAILLLTSWFDTTDYSPGGIREAYGFPLTIYELPGCEPVPPSYECPGYRIVYSGLFFDIMFWYLISCFIVWTYNKYKVKK